MWTTENRARYDRSRLRYPSDLTDDEWSWIRPLIPPARPGGNKRTVVKDDPTAALVAWFARRRDSNKQAAIRPAEKAELTAAVAHVSVEDQLRKFWAENPTPLRTGNRADKAFFDDLSGGL